MIRYTLRRVLYTIPILAGVILFTFILFFGIASPDTIARKNLSAKNPAHAEIQKWIHDHGYDKPMVQQFQDHMTGLLLFRFGNSDRTKEPIGERIAQGIGPSGQVAGMILLSSLVAGLTIAAFIAYFRGTYVDTSATLTTVAAMSIVYVVYVIGLQFLLGKLLNYGPIAGYQPGADSWRFILLPATVGVAARLGSDVRLYRTFLLDEIGQDYVRTARSKGVREGKVLSKHVLKNAMIPVVTSTASSIPLVVMGSLILESFFGIPGLGGYLQEAIVGQDFPVVRAMVFLGTLLYIGGLLLTDVLYAALDPRLRIE